MTDIKRSILRKLKPRLTREFKENFRRKAFFDKPWQDRKDKEALGSLLIVSGALRRSIQSQITNDGIRFTSNVPYASAHNEGVRGRIAIKSHSRRSRKGKVHPVKAHSKQVNLPQRQFIGDHSKVRSIIKEIIDEELEAFNQELLQQLKQ